jgi:hypothetical protein
MPRIRTLKPEIIDDAATAGLSDSAFRLFVSLIVLADDHGNVRGEDWWLRARVWKARREPPRVAEILREVADAGLAIVYSVREQTYVHLRGFEKHQRIDNRGKGLVPSPKDPDAQVIVNVRGEPPRIAANLREIPPDQNQDQDLGSGSGAGATSSLGTTAGSGTPTPEPPAKRIRVQRTGPLPAEWAPRSEELALARDLGVDPTRKAASFVDHHGAKGSRFVDWHAAFRTWLRHAVKFNRGGGRAAAPSLFEIIDSLPLPPEARS